MELSELLTLLDTAFGATAILLVVRQNARMTRLFRRLGIVESRVTPPVGVPILIPRGERSAPMRAAPRATTNQDG